MDELLLHREPGIAIVTLSRPQRRNAVTLDMWRALARMLSELQADDAVRGLAITGVQGHFSAGAELAQYAAGVAEADAIANEVDACVDILANWPKPTVAAVSGSCIGGGLMIATACDFRIADATARFGVPVARLGNVYRMEATEGLLRLVGLAVAKRMMFSGETIDGVEAARVGLVDRLASEPLAAALAFLQPMLDKAPLSLAAAKLALNAAVRGQAEQQAAAVRALSRRALESADFQEGMRAFQEKRRPVFTGR